MTALRAARRILAAAAALLLPSVLMAQAPPPPRQTVSSIARSPYMVGYFASSFVKPEANICNVFHSREGQESERPQVPNPGGSFPVPDGSAGALALKPFAGRYGTVTIAVAKAGLDLRQDRRPALTLLPTGRDLFTVAGEPSRRVRFERDAAGEVVALEQMWSDGNSVRRSRD